ncbi:MAG: tRNA (adenosine(37)-N6)-threonylcarbamoyltransferase complex dimerization subunit type 1 TsaB [Planctomycetota bacterium]|jgi:tRNA threonylcarbamoyladenosine biosynthesis protein TsaB
MSINTPDTFNQTQKCDKNTNQSVENHIIQNPLILAIETSGRTGSAAIAIGKQILAETAFSAPMKHCAEVFPAVCSLLNRFDRKPKEIKHIYISAGPGSFTGLRIAATMAKTMHLANKVKIVAVDTLDVIAENATDYIKENDKSLDTIATILDAKRGQFFIAIYEIMQGRWVKSLPDCLMTAPQLLEKCASRTKPIWLLGEGLVYYRDKFKAQGIEFINEPYWYPKALKVHLLGWQKALQGQFAEPLTLKPTYLRKPEIGINRKAAHLD